MAVVVCVLFFQCLVRVVSKHSQGGDVEDEGALGILAEVSKADFLTGDGYSIEVIEAFALEWVSTGLVGASAAFATSATTLRVHSVLGGSRWI